MIPLNPKRAGGGGGGRIPPPLDVSRNMSAMHRAVDTPFHDFFLSSLAQLLRPNLRHPGTRFQSYATFRTCSSDQKLLKNVISCTNPIQIVFQVNIHKCMIIFAFTA